MNHWRKLASLSLGGFIRTFNGKNQNLFKEFQNHTRLVQQCFYSNNLVNVIENKQKKRIQLEWDNGKVDEFANIFLRDHCKCPKCYDEFSSNRLQEVYTIPLDVEPVEVNVSQGSLNVNWSDNHLSEYSFDYLQNVQRGLNDDVRYLPPNLWKKCDIEKHFPEYSLEDIVQNESTMLEWFLDLKQTGVTMIVDAGESLDVLDYCRDKLFGGYYKSSHYG